MKLAAADNNAPYLAVFHAVSDLANGLAIVGGGLVFDRLIAGGSDALRLSAQLFFAAWIGRTLAAGLLDRLIEPGAKRLRELV